MGKLLALNSTGDEVVKLQKALGVKADGIFGKNTRIALIKFQKENGLRADGIAGPKTLSVLYGTKKEKSNGLLALNSTGDEVVKLQKALGVKADGIFGKNTRIALIKFQKENGLRGDGIAGPKTLSALYNKKDKEDDKATEKPSKITSSDIKNLIKTAVEVIDTYKKNRVKYSQPKRQFGLDAKFADCSSTVSTILRLAKLSSYLKSTNTRSMRAEISSKNGVFRKNNPKPGDIMMWGKHVTLVTKVTNMTVYFAHMGSSGPAIGSTTLKNDTLKSESTWGSGGFIGFWTIF